ncbi:MAG TPA: spore germination protein GerW family protein [Mycobacteriales bacterium]|nr:spore germination protein GerW family protein [Mycobacteriales bacterium]
MNLQELTAAARDTLTVKRVYGEPYERDGITVIPAARVSGGGGGGSGHDPHGQDGEGGGFGAQARPAGAYVVRDGRVHWQPAIDVNKLAGVIGAVAISWIVTRARTQRLNAKLALVERKIDHRIAHDRARRRRKADAA